MERTGGEGARRCGLKDIFAWHEKSLVIVSLSITQKRLQFLADETWRMWVQTRGLFRMYLPNNEDIVDLPVHFTFSLVYYFLETVGTIGGRIYKSMHINKAVLRCLVC